MRGFRPALCGSPEETLITSSYGFLAPCAHAEFKKEYQSCRGHLKTRLWIFQMYSLLPDQVLQWFDLPVHSSWKNPDLSCSSHWGWFPASKTSFISSLLPEMMASGCVRVVSCKPSARLLIWSTLGFLVIDANTLIRTRIVWKPLVWGQSPICSLCVRFPAEPPVEKVQRHTTLYTRCLSRINSRGHYFKCIEFFSNRRLKFKLIINCNHISLLETVGM